MLDHFTVTQLCPHLQTLVLGSVVAASKLFMYGLSRTVIEGEAVLQRALARPPGQPLITGACVLFCVISSTPSDRYSMQH